MDKLLTSNIKLGILGGGQLGRMSAMAAARLGISVTIYTPEGDSPASKVSDRTIVAEYSDKAALEEFAQSVDYISYEFENIPVETVEILNGFKKGVVLPDQKLLHISQDRIQEKSFLNDNGIQTARWAEIATLEDIRNALSDWSADGFILKTTRFGYDGKGQIKCDTQGLEENSELNAFLAADHGSAIIMEDIVPFTHEASAIVARDIDGNTVTYGPMLNEHRNHILHTTTVPADFEKPVEEKILNVSKKVADMINLTGVLTIEFFITPDGRVLVNEIAPRTHNSGHWTIDACTVSQFENHVRTVCHLPVSDPYRHSDAVMLNLIGDDIIKAHDYINDPTACVHIYGKTEIRNGRKMGHINFIKPPSDK